MTDYTRHKSNVRKMIEAGAPEADIDAYLSGEGVTAEQLRGETQAPASVEPVQMETPEIKAPTASGVVAGLSRGATIGADQHIEAALSSIIPANFMAGGADVKFGDYKGNLGKIRDRNSAIKEAAPVAHGVGEVAGNIAGLGKAYSAGLTATKAVPQGLSGAKKLAATTGALAVDGAVIAGSEAAFDGKSVDEIGGAAQKGALFSGGANVALSGAQKMASPLLSKVTDNISAEKLKSLRNVAYKRLDNFGVRYAPEATDNLRQGIGDALLNDTVGLDKAIHPATSKIFKTLQDFKGDMPFTKLEQLRKRAARVASNPNGGEDAYAASILAKDIDDFVAAAPATTSHTGANGETVANTVKEARELHRRFKGHETVMGASDKAIRRGGGSTGSGANMDNAIRQNIRQILDNPKRVKFFNAAERKAMEKVVMGSKGGNVARLLGKAAPTGSVSSVLSGTAGAAIGGPVGVAAFLGGGHMARKTSEKITKKHIDELLHLLRNGEALERVSNAAGQLVEGAAPVAATTTAAVMANQ